MGFIMHCCSDCVSRLVDKLANTLSLFLEASILPQLVPIATIRVAIQGYTLLVYAGYMHIIIAYSCSQSVHHSNNLLDTGLMSLRGKLMARLPEYGLLC